MKILSYMIQELSCVVLIIDCPFYQIPPLPESHSSGGSLEKKRKKITSVYVSEQHTH